MSPSTSLGPEHALFGLRDGTNALEDEPLNARSGIGLSRIEVPLRIGRKVVDAEELTWTASAIAERSQHLERAAKQDVDFFVDAIGRVDIGLLGISRKRHVPHGTRPERVGIDEGLLHERAVLTEDLTPVVHAIAHIHEAVISDDRTVHGVELFRRSSLRLV